MSTCLPAGSIVTTASAPVTAAAAEAERLHPASTAFARAVSERSNAATSWPAFARSSEEHTSELQSLTHTLFTYPPLFRSLTPDAQWPRRGSSNRETGYPALLHRKPHGCRPCPHAYQPEELSPRHRHLEQRQQPRRSCCIRRPQPSRALFPKGRTRRPHGLPLPGSRPCRRPYCPSR